MLARGSKPIFKPILKQPHATEPYGFRLSPKTETRLTAKPKTGKNVEKFVTFEPTDEKLSRDPEGSDEWEHVGEALSGPYVAIPDRGGEERDQKSEILKNRDFDLKTEFFDHEDVTQPLQSDAGSKKDIFSEFPVKKLGPKPQNSSRTVVLNENFDLEKGGK